MIDNYMVVRDFNAFAPILAYDEVARYTRTFYERYDEEVDLEDAYLYAWEHMTDEEKAESLQYNDTQEQIIEYFYSGDGWSLRKEGEII